MPLGVFALAGRSILGRIAAVRRHGETVRRVAGAVLVLTALALAFNLTDGLQRTVPGYTEALQNRIETGAAAKRALAGVTGASTSGQTRDLSLPTARLSRSAERRPRSPASLGGSTRLMAGRCRWRT